MVDGCGACMADRAKIPKTAISIGLIRPGVNTSRSRDREVNMSSVTFFFFFRGAGRKRKKIIRDGNK